MRKLTIESLGEDNIVQGVILKGDRRSPEPESFRVMFPGGHVDVTRNTDGTYWVHIGVNRAEDVVATGALVGKLIDARLDIAGKRDVDTGDFGHMGLYHLAVRVQT